jgi:hypothetical protein
MTSGRGVLSSDLFRGVPEEIVQGVIRSARRLQRMQECQQRLAEIGCGAAPARLARLLLRLDSGDRRTSGPIVIIGLMREDLAGLSGSTIYTASQDSGPMGTPGHRAEIEKRRLRHRSAAPRKDSEFLALFVIEQTTRCAKRITLGVRLTPEWTRGFPIDPRVFGNFRKPWAPTVAALSLRTRIYPF